METELKLLEANIEAVKTAARGFADLSADNILRNLPQSHKGLPKDYFFCPVGSKDDLSDWGNQPYKQSEYMPDRKIHLTSRGLAVRSKSEMLIVTYDNEDGSLDLAVIESEIRNKLL